MKALGATCGIGSMLIGAREAGFGILGNIEWRKYYHIHDKEGRNTFKKNFVRSFLVKDIKELNPIDYPSFHSVLRNSQIDLIMGHPDCGNYSRLSRTSGDMTELLKSSGDIPIFVDIIKRLKPRYFVQDNLPKSLNAYTIQEWVKELPEYDLFPEWVSNWGYGNIQKGRDRLFIIGALKTEKFSFYAHEEDHNKTVEETLYGHKAVFRSLPNNEPHSLAGKSSKGKGLVGKEHMTFAELSDYILNKLPDGKTMFYIQDGKKKSHAGTQKFYRYKHAFVLTGGNSLPLSPWTGFPFSIRERARIQGCPDNFVFYGTKLEPDGSWNSTRNGDIVKQVAKFMPVQFSSFIAKQIADHIKGKEGRRTSLRIIKPNPHIDKAKLWYCKNIGYSDQDSVCRKCWIEKCWEK